MRLRDCVHTSQTSGTPTAASPSVQLKVISRRSRGHRRSRSRGCFSFWVGVTTSTPWAVAVLILCLERSFRHSGSPCSVMRQRSATSIVVMVAAAAYSCGRRGPCGSQARARLPQDCALRITSGAAWTEAGCQDLHARRSRPSLPQRFGRRRRRRRSTDAQIAVILSGALTAIAAIGRSTIPSSLSTPRAVDGGRLSRYIRAV